MYKERRKKITNQIENNSIIILASGKLIKKTADQTYSFCVNKNFFYLTGINEDNLFLILSNTNGEYKEFLFINENDETKIKWVGKKLEVDEVTKTSEFDAKNVFFNNSLESFLNNAFKANRKALINDIENIYFDSDNDNSILIELLDKYIYTKKDIFLTITNERRYKDSFEVSKIQRAIEITNIGLESIRINLTEAKNEIDLDAIYDYTLKTNFVHPSFDTIIGSGVNGTILHYSQNNSILRSEDLVLCDLGAYYDGYASDITRTYPISGKFSPRQKQIYEIVLKANKESIKFLKPGISYSEFLQFGKDILAKECLKIGLIKDEKEIDKYYFHGLGHFLGLDVHDVGSYNEPLREGIVITVEPGLYLEEEGIGIRIEDDVLITKDGSINLSHMIPKEIKDIEF